MSYHIARLKKFVSRHISKLCNWIFYLPIFIILCMCHLLYLIFRCDFDVMESLKILKELGELNTRSEGMKIRELERRCSQISAVAVDSVPRQPQPGSDFGFFPSFYENTIYFCFNRKLDLNFPPFLDTPSNVR